MTKREHRKHVEVMTRIFMRRMVEADGPPGVRGEPEQTRGYSKGDVSQGKAGWDTSKYDAAVFRIRYRLHRQEITQERAARMMDKIEKFRAARSVAGADQGEKRERDRAAYRSDHRESAADRFKRVYEGSAPVSAGYASADEVQDSRRGASDQYPVDDGEPDDPMQPGWRGPNLDEDEDEDDVEQPADRAPVHRVQVRCPHCSERFVVNPPKGHRLGEAVEGVNSLRVATACPACEKGIEVTPPKGYAWLKGSRESAAQSFWRRYLKANRHGTGLPS